ncbi:MAG TPA: tRNA (adenosine(37)-N6)-threonylcarbamoyltransferase complex ATPase subunit type 1 TsaE, partial [Zoogloea sp.]|nr:tRNA (adenosine(37)-N6)-threonylcarbamoyltransferase complex ATPase subunit type 1 TsaE [Zoogloea sp.]
DEYFEGSGIRLVEWPERAQPFLPEADLEIRLQIDSGGGRTLTLWPLSPEGRTCLQNLDSSAAAPP